MPSPHCGRRTHRSLDLFKCSRVRLHRRRTEAALAGSGIGFPEITSGDFAPLPPPCRIHPAVHAAPSPTRIKQPQVRCGLSRLA